MTDILRERSTEHAVEDAVRFERSMDARSARMDWGFYVFYEGMFWSKKRKRTIMYDTRKLINGRSDRGDMSRGESERLTRERNASCATLFHMIRVEKIKDNSMAH
jgi:hypothetical protein